MAEAIRGISLRRAAIVLAVAAVTMFLVSGLMSGEPEAQTSASNGKIAYAGFTVISNSESTTDIYTMNPDGTGVTNLTSRYTNPPWSPLGSASGDPVHSGGPEWSPDGTRISFSGTAVSDIGSCCSTNVYVMEAGGANLQQLTHTPSSSEGQDYQSTWAPDGSWLAFTSTRTGNREIYRMNADGTNEQQLTTTAANITDEQPTISPDGTKIAFASYRHYDSARLNDQLDIYVMDADGGNVKRLTEDAAPTSPTLNMVSESRNPAWSPDGTRIAYESTRSGNSEIWVINADPDGTGEPVNVSNHSDWDREPAWSPDGTQITFMSERAGQEDIWAVDAPPPASPTTAASFSALDVGTDTALAASTPRNLTANNNRAAKSPDWGTAPPSSANTCTIESTSAADTLTGTSGADVICALGGNDTVYGAGGADVIEGGRGDDTLNGQGGNDRVIGNAGSDNLFGANGDDTLKSKDTISGNDSLSGGTHLNGDTKVTDATEKSIFGFP